MTSRPMFSVIIPFRKMDDYTKECLEHLMRIKSTAFEVILLPDGKMKKPPAGMKCFDTGPVKPSVKRNLGAEKAQGKYLAFIDSDAYPDGKWMAKAAVCLEKKEAGIIGGPNLHPDGDSVWQKASDDILSSRIGSGGFSARYSARGGVRDVTELPSCNMFISRELFRKVGGFDESLLTGEDAKLCFQVRNAGRKVLYCPGVVVFHHRRALFRPHLRQMWRYGSDKSKVLGLLPPRKRVVYTMPSLLVIFAVAGIILALNPWFRVPLAVTSYVGLMILYLLAAAAGSVRSGSRFPLVFTGIILTHFAYGLGFIRGLLSGKN